MAATATNDNVADADVSSTNVLYDNVKAYLKDMAIGGNGSPLTWWRRNKSRFSCLAKLAHSLLAILATSVNSERLNSKSGNIVSIKRCSLLSQHVEELAFLHKSL